jgi:hypothetical protein
VQYAPGLRWRISAPAQLANKDEEAGDCNGHKHNDDQGCIEQIPDRKIFVFTYHGRQFSDPRQIRSFIRVSSG